MKAPYRFDTGLPVIYFVGLYPFNLHPTYISKQIR